MVVKEKIISQLNNVSLLLFGHLLVGPSFEWWRKKLTFSVNHCILHHQIVDATDVKVKTCRCARLSCLFLSFCFGVLALLSVIWTETRHVVTQSVEWIRRCIVLLDNTVVLHTVTNFVITNPATTIVIAFRASLRRLYHVAPAVRSGSTYYNVILVLLTICYRFSVFALDLDSFSKVVRFVCLSCGGTPRFYSIESSAAIRYQTFTLQVTQKLTTINFITVIKSRLGPRERFLLFQNSIVKGSVYICVLENMMIDWLTLIESFGLYRVVIIVVMIVESARSSPTMTIFFTSLVIGCWRLAIAW